MADLELLVKGMLMLPDGVRRLTATPMLLRHAKSQASVELKRSISSELRSFGEFLGRASELIVTGLKAAGVSEVDQGCQTGVPLASVPHLIPRPHVERPGTAWVGAWAQPAIHVKRHVLTQVTVQTPSEEGWGEVPQPAWSRPGFSNPE
uniref:Uncharacterized protein n=1 Tax=Hemiselmis andersenii TaxID=464988 RepID=A0A7S1E1H2_HEMAN|mmetsp:Transcript_31831/g.77686  ORF Transcript_31831/g.77686 Transcript_31831/m.77686 type:complete len:149 (-) Transcript_31831:3-449(-)